MGKKDKKKGERSGQPATRRNRRLALLALSSRRPLAWPFLNEFSSTYGLVPLFPLSVSQFRSLFLSPRWDAAARLRFSSFRGRSSILSFKVCQMCSTSLSAIRSAYQLRSSTRSHRASLADLSFRRPWRRAGHSRHDGKSNAIGRRRENEREKDTSKNRGVWKRDQDAVAAVAAPDSARHTANVQQELRARYQ